jgi:hypothetical protein
MPITLGQIAQVEKDPLAKYMEIQILRECKAMNFVPFENVDSLQVRALMWTQLPTGGGWRALNEGYASAEDGQLGEEWEALYGFGGDITFDKIISKIKNTIKDPVQLQVDGKLKAMSIQWNDKLINGDIAVDPKAFNGLKKRVAGMPTRQTVWWTALTSSAGLDPTASAANARRFINTLRKAWKFCNGGKVDAILCNEDFILGFSAALTYAQTQGNYLDTTKDQWDQEWVTYRGKPLVDMGYLADQATEILPVSELGGDSSANTHSQYLVSFNTVEGIHGIQLNNFTAYDPLGGTEMESKPSQLRRIDWWNGIASFGTRGIVRVKNLLKLASWTES